LSSRQKISSGRFGASLKTVTTDNFKSFKGISHFRASVIKMLLFPSSTVSFPTWISNQVASITIASIN